MGITKAQIEERAKRDDPNAWDTDFAQSLATDEWRALLAKRRDIALRWAKRDLEAEVAMTSDRQASTDAVPVISLRHFLKTLSQHDAPENKDLSANTLRMMIGDLRKHAQRLYAELRETP